MEGESSEALSASQSRVDDGLVPIVLDPVATIRESRGWRAGRLCVVEFFGIGIRGNFPLDFIRATSYLARQR
jgi:hypothetical protein